ncbi:MAG: type II secretion system protein GspM [Legionella sp.]|jgi:general secretion pathway protein M
MKAYLNSLNERERWMVLLGGLSLVLYCYYIFLYAPIHNRVQQKSAILAEQIDTLNWMKKVKGEAHTTKTKKTVDNNQLLTLLATQLKQDDELKSAYQIQQTASGEIQLSFEAVPFSLFMKWLAEINKEYSIIIKQLNVEHSKTPGVTRLTVIITS